MCVCVCVCVYESKLCVCVCVCVRLNDKMITTMSQTYVVSVTLCNQVLHDFVAHFRFKISLLPFACLGFYLL